VHPRGSDALGRSLGKLPKLPFPSFEGDNPRLWISRCEKYFGMYEVDAEAWVQVASMHLSPQVACWFQSIERQHPNLSWPLLCRLLHDRIGRDQLQFLLRQLFRIQQQGSVSEYQDRFVTLVDQLAVYDSVPDPMFFATRFVEGLRSDIHAVVMLQRPLDLDSACSLALLQEEVATPSVRPDHRKGDFRTWSKPSAPHPLPLPPHAVPKVGAPEKKSDHSSSVDSKLGALKAYRRARGLCDRCAEKWHRGHTCNTTVQLHAIQEVWDLLSNVSVEDTIVYGGSPEDSMLMSISSEAIAGVAAKRSIRFMGLMQAVDILILVDSGSTNSFINQSTVLKLGLKSVPGCPLQVQVADGTILSCTNMISQAVWSIQGCSFVQDLHVLNLPTFDLILGMDWLERYSPMKVHWQHKWLCIPYHGEQVMLYGCSAVMATDLLLHITPISAAVVPADDSSLDPLYLLFCPSLLLFLPSLLLFHQFGLVTMLYL
jgi:hypothetical protein